ncbi:hypothetical protein CDN97_22820 [Pantoea sp. AMG 501]|nr:hypothetical protein CDN97_22820 [Pantoea sp. AMG 501]
MALFRSGYPFSFCVLKRFQIYNVRFQTRINKESTREASFIQSAGPAVILKRIKQSGAMTRQHQSVRSDLIQPDDEENDMFRDREKLTNIITGEALLSLLAEGAPVSSESLAERLRHFLGAEEDAHRRKSILAALTLVNILSVHHEPMRTCGGKRICSGNEDKPWGYFGSDMKH